MGLDIGEVRKLEIADKFAELIADDVDEETASDMIGIQYSLSPAEVLSVVREVKKRRDGRPSSG